MKYPRRLRRTPVLGVDEQKIARDRSRTRDVRRFSVPTETQIDAKFIVENLGMFIKGVITIENLNDTDLVKKEAARVGCKDI